ncbi:MAG: hypothetical protein AAFU41_02790 [Pseudomonadota bacterium]
MNFWVAYCAAFVSGGAILSLVFYIAFDALMTGYRVSEVGAMFLLLVLPPLCGLIIFGLSFGAFRRERLTVRDWIVLTTLVAIVVCAGMALLFANAMREIDIRWLMAAALFVGGAAILRWRSA